MVLNSSEIPSSIFFIILSGICFLSILLSGFSINSLSLELDKNFKYISLDFSKSLFLSKAFAANSANLKDGWVKAFNVFL